MNENIFLMIIGWISATIVATSLIISLYLAGKNTDKLTLDMAKINYCQKIVIYNGNKELIWDKCKGKNNGN